MKKVLLGMLLVVLVVVAIACAPAATPAPTAAPATAAPKPTTAPATAAPVAPTTAPAAPTTAAAAPLKIGLLSDQTGGLAIYGPMLEQGFAMGLDYATGGTNAVNGRPIQVDIRDTASKPDVGTQVARDLIEKENVDILVGPPSSSVALAVAELAKQNKKILVASPAASSDITGKNFNPYVFRTGRTSDQDALTMGAALTKSAKKFLQIAPDNAFGQASAAGFYAVLKAGGGTFVKNDSADKFGTVFIPADAKDYTAYLQQVLDSKPEVLVVTWAGDFTALFTQMTQLGVFKTITVATGMGDNQTLKKGYATAIGSVGVSVYHYSLPKNAVNDWLVQKSQDKYKAPPDLFTEGGFTAAQMVVAGLKATNGDSNADKLIPVFEKLSFDGPKGKYTVRAYDHVMLQTLYLVKLANVTDANFKFFELVTELKPEDTAPPCKLEGDYKSRCPAK